MFLENRTENLRRKRKQTHRARRRSPGKAREPARLRADGRRDAAIRHPATHRRLRPGRERAASCSDGVRVAGSRPPVRPPVGPSVRRGSCAPGSRLARFRGPRPPARLPAGLASRRTTCGLLSIYQAPSSRALRPFRSRAPRPCSGPGLTC